MKPLWISHRGYKANYDENTVGAFRAAVHEGFKALETDLRVTRDGQVVLMHDPDLFRVAGDPRRVSDLTRADLQHIRFLQGGVPLFLDQFMEEFRGLSWTFDVKGDHGDRTVDALADLVRRTARVEELVEQTRFAVWRAGHEARVKGMLPGARFYARTGECWRAGVAVLVGVPAAGKIVAGRTYSLRPRVGRVAVFRDRIVRTFSDRGARTLAFLPKTDGDVLDAIGAGVDEILTDGLIVAAPSPDLPSKEAVSPDSGGLQR